MVLARRLDKLEAELEPESAVLHWLAEAHEYPTLDAYTEWWQARPESEHPLVRIPQQLEEATRKRLRGQRRHVDHEVHKVVRAAAFRVYLVVFLNLDAADTIRVHGLLHLALTWRMRELSFRDVLAEMGEEGGFAGEADTLERDWASWGAVVREQISSLRGMGRGRQGLERRNCLASVRELDPETADGFRGLVGRVESLCETITKTGIAPVVDPVDEARTRPTRRRPCRAARRIGIRRSRCLHGPGIADGDHHIRASRGGPRLLGTVPLVVGAQLDL